MLKWPQRIFYKSLIVAALLDKGGTPFEDWFVELASRLWGSDFEPVRAQGRLGDLKCDGRRISTGTIYQCYGPRRVDEKNVGAKIRNDFAGAREQWGDEMKEWAIVINDREGLDVVATQEVEALREEHPKCEIKVVGPVEITKLALSLSPCDLADFCGAQLEEADYQQWRITFPDIATIVANLTAPTPSKQPPIPPPADKIQRNSLEGEIITLLTKGNILTKQVEDFFSKTPDVELEARVAGKLTNAYAAMKEGGDDPSHIFYSLVSLAGGLDRPAGEQHAVLGVITYFFNKCDIFESEAV